MQNNPTAESVIETFEQRWTQLLGHAPICAKHPEIRPNMRIIYIGAGLALLSARINALPTAEANRVADILAAEALEISRRFILESKQKGPVQ